MHCGGAAVAEEIVPQTCVVIGSVAARREWCFTLFRESAAHHRTVSSTKSPEYETY